MDDKNQAASRFVEMKIAVSEEVHLAIMMRAKAQGQKANSAVVRTILANGLASELEEIQARKGRRS